MTTLASEVAAGAVHVEADEDAVLAVTGLTKHFDVRDARGDRRRVRAVDGIDLSLRAGETLSLVGESGCGKSTTGRLIMGLLQPTAGRVVFDGEDVTGYNRGRMRAVRRRMQLVFQDPYSSLNPRMRMRDLISEPLRVHRALPRRACEARVDELIRQVGLDPEQGRRFPHEFSGGQRQRIGIARALALSPKLLVLDEPVSALDVSIQAQIINLLKDLQEELGLAYLFISHDLSVVRHISTRVAVMYLGRIVETGTADEVFASAGHPYTQALISAVPSGRVPGGARRERIVLPGDVPDPADPPSGCRFRLRCFKARPDCAELVPALKPRPDVAHPTACHYAQATTRRGPGS